MSLSTSSEINEKPTVDELIERFAEVQNISVEEARELVGADNENEVIQKITDYTVNKINGGAKLNRAQRRALAKKNKGKKAKAIVTSSPMEVINETAAKLNYIDLIQKLRKLNEEKAKENEENGTATIENN